MIFGINLCSIDDIYLFFCHVRFPMLTLPKLGIPEAFYNNSVTPLDSRMTFFKLALFRPRGVFRDPQKFLSITLGPFELIL